MAKQQARLSLVQQWLLIALAAVVPLLSVAAYATWALYQQMHQQRAVVQQVDRVGHLQSALNEQLRELERSARQYRLLRDPRFLELYHQKQAQLEPLRAELPSLQPAPESLSATGVAEKQQSLLDVLVLLDRVVEQMALNPLPELDDQRYAELVAQLSQVRTDLELHLSGHIQQLTARSEAELQATLWRLSLLGLVVLPLTLVLMGLGFVQMIRPVRRLSKAIQLLGQGDWHSSIRVRGPRDLQALGENLESLRGQLLETDRQKQAFLRHISHELKTPLAAILEAGSLLEDEVPGALTDAQRNVLGILRANSQNLQELIQQLLNYNVITYGFTVERAWVDLQALCQKLTARLDQHSALHRVQWLLPEQSFSLRTDPQLLEMMLVNLLSNAFHYSPAGARVQVRWGLEAQICWISVEDQGPGIPLEDQARIFEPFAQGSARRHGPVQGSGVGLAIVRESINNLGGSITLESNPGAGSRFTLRFPIHEE